MGIEIFKTCLLGLSLLAAVSGTAVIDPSLSRFLGGGGGGTESVMVSFTESLSSVFSQINSMTFNSQLDKRNALTELQQTFTNAAQGALQSFLSIQGVQFESFWINNKVIIPNASPFLVNAIKLIPGVSKVEKEPVIPINVPGGVPEPEERLHTRQVSLEWGIEKIRANEVWGSFNGTGIVIAGIDTGVRYTHESLADRWRRDYGWWDPYFFTQRPNDFNGHGTHTMGTIAGTHGIGVAPGATWIACRGCSFTSCSAGQLMSCGQWVQCPFRPNGTGRNCSYAPHIVSNSWGGRQNDPWYDQIITSWQTSGIIPVVSIGNSGSRCHSANSPGDRPNVIGVGSTESDDSLSDFSSRGPTIDGTVKPDISAPGGKVRSAWWTSDRAYNTISGTSMACPMVSGVIGLMKQKNPGIVYQDIYNAITQTAVTSSLNIGARPCGFKQVGEFPNNEYGYGRIDAVNSVNAI